MAEEITDGSYETRITVKSQDEVGLLAENFNRVAEAVSEKIGELQGMVRKRDQLVISFPKADGWSGCRESSEVLKVVIPSFEAKGLVLKENIEPAVLYGNKELLVVLTGIFLPGILIEGQERKAVGE